MNHYVLLAICIILFALGGAMFIVGLMAGSLKAAVIGIVMAVVAYIIDVYNKLNNGNYG